MRIHVQRQTSIHDSKAQQGGHGLASIQDNRLHTSQLLRIQQSADNKIGLPPVQRKENNTGLPENLKSGIEILSGYSMDDVKVHYNSSKPAQLNAHAYAQGADIHLASGQEKHLPHEAWHVVQQKQNRVQPTMQMHQGDLVNDDAGLEREADVMGAKSLSLATAQLKCDECEKEEKQASDSAIQRQIIQRHTVCTESTHASSLQEKTIVADYKRWTGNSNTYGEYAIDKDTDPNEYVWGFIDLADEDDKEIYEIKSAKTGASTAAREAGWYVDWINSDANKCKGGGWKKGRTFGAETVDVGLFNFEYESTKDGAITYRAQEKSSGNWHYD